MYIYNHRYVYIHLICISIYTHCMHIYIYIYIFIHVHIYTHIYIHTHLSICILIYICIHTVCTYIYIFIHAHTHIYIHPLIYMYAYIYIYIYICIYSVYIYIYIWRGMFQPVSVRLLIGVPYLIIWHWRPIWSSRWSIPLPIHGSSRYGCGLQWVYQVVHGGELPTNRKWVSSPQFFEWMKPTKIPLITQFISHLLSGMNHQVDIWS